jgi:hypothetical protein
MRSTLYLLILLLCAQPALADAGPLQRDERLQQRVTVERPYATVAEVLEEIRRATGAPVLAAPTVAEENVTVFAREKPAAELLEVISETLRLQWRVERGEDGTPRYRLYQEARRRREALRERERYRREALELARKECQTRIEVNAIPRREYFQRVQGLERRLQQADLPAADRAGAEEELAVLKSWQGDADGVLFPLALRVWPELTPLLMSGGAMLLSSHPVDGAAPLPPWAAEPILETHLRDPGFRAVVARAASVPETRLHVRAEWSATSLTIDLVASVEVSVPEDVRMPVQASALVLDLTGHEPDRLDADDPRLLQEVDVAMAPKFPIRFKRDNPLTCFAVIFLGDLAEALHAARPNVAIVADGHLGRLAAAPTRGRLLDILNDVALEAGSRCEWDPRGYVRILQRDGAALAGVPATVFRDLYDRAAAQEGLVLDDFVWLATRLNDEQIDGLALPRRVQGKNMVIPMYLPGSILNWEMLGRNRHDLRFYASLSAEQREQLIGGVLWGWQLTLQQQHALQQLLRQRHDWDLPRLHYRALAEMSRVQIRLQPLSDSLNQRMTGVTFEYRLDGAGEPLRSRTILTRQ